MKKIFAGLTALAICGALNFGLMNEAQAAVADSSTGLGGIELNEMAMLPPPPPPPPRPHHHHQLPPNPYDDDWSHGHVPPPPPPPPPPHRH